MRVLPVLVAALLSGLPAAAQDRPVSSPETTVSTAPDVAGLPVSFDRIRDELAKPAPLLRGLPTNPTFRVEIQERVRLDQILSTLDYKAGPVPAGGVYGYEQQQRLWNKVDYPLMQPYAAFSGSEFATIAIENLVAKYLGGHLLSVVSTALREHAETAARNEVAQAIATYCDGRPDRYDIKLCEDTGSR
jgi:hypothetical protein